MAIEREMNLTRIAGHLAAGYLRNEKVDYTGEPLAKWFCSCDEDDAALWKHAAAAAEKDSGGKYMGGLRGQLRACLVAAFGRPDETPGD